MPQFSQTATINASPEKVFAVISDPNQIPKWRTEVPEVTNVSGGGVGLLYTEAVLFMGKQQLNMKVTEFEPSKRFVTSAQSGMSVLPTQAFTLTPENGATHLRLDVDLRVTGLMKLMAPMFPSQFKKIWARYFVNLNTYLNS